MPGTIPCDCTAGTLLSWCAPQGGSVRLDDDRMLAYWPKFGMLGFPLLASGTPPAPEELRNEVAALRSSGASVNRIIDVPIEWAEAHATALAPWCSSETTQDGRDYIYSVSDLADLPGSKYSAKRNLISQFIREHPDWRIEPLQPNSLDNPRFKRFIEGWRKAAANPSASLLGDLNALDAAFRHWNSGIFTGLSLHATDSAHGHDALLAFCVFSVPTRDMADIHFEKATHDVKGASQLINRETARHLRDSGIRWINREQDMGVSGLRMAKMQYHPAFLLPTCSLRLSAQP